MSALRDALRDLPEAVFADVLESDDAYLVVIDLPGTTAETVEITVKNNHVAIEARRSKNVDRAFRFLSEERSLFLDVDLPLPLDAVADEATASIERGVLELEVPKESATSETPIPVTEA
ncbi:Hsp20/alpha crystallin family protein [Halobacteriaceae archaeon SHR40]|uniref:Hsp20/alpha crystallin family protein n=1 Tax=Halovenus amylolytica TaxID=2500550 RepID=UPI000FE42E80